MVPRENKNNAYAKFGGTNKQYYGIFRNGLYDVSFTLIKSKKIIRLLSLEALLQVKPLPTTDK